MMLMLKMSSLLHVANVHREKESFIEGSRLNNVPGKFLRVDVAPAQDQPDLLARHRADLESDDD